MEQIYEINIVLCNTKYYIIIFILQVLCETTTVQPIQDFFYFYRMEERKGNKRTIRIIIWGVVIGLFLLLLWENMKDIYRHIYN